MSAAPKPFLSPQEYLAREREAETKSEYYDGETFAMAGGSEEHSLIVVNMCTALLLQLADRPCKVYNSDMRVRVEEDGPYAYPDVSVVCGEAEFADEERDNLLNPTVIVEVLSPSTEAYDRGDKFAHYRRLETLREYVLIAQDQLRIEHYRREGAGWVLTEISDPNGTLNLPSIDCHVAVSAIYEKIEFDPELPLGRRVLQQ